jgi:DNA-binding NarL/FixJ family response regulator
MLTGMSNALLEARSAQRFFEITRASGQATRNEAVLKALHAGHTQREVAAATGLSTGMIAKIAARAPQ